MNLTYSLHCSSCLGLSCKILTIETVTPKTGTPVETILGEPSCNTQREKDVRKALVMDSPNSPKSPVPIYIDPKVPI